jgi:hypothetical protein
MAEHFTSLPFANPAPAPAPPTWYRRQVVPCVDCGLPSVMPPIEKHYAGPPLCASCQAEMWRIAGKVHHASSPTSRNDELGEWTFVPDGSGLGTEARAKP